MRRMTGRLPECPRKMADRQLAFGGNLTERKAAFKICRQHLARATELPSGKPAFGWSSERPQSAIRLRDVRSKGEGHMVDEEGVCLLRPLERELH